MNRKVTNPLTLVVAVLAFMAFLLVACGDDEVAVATTAAPEEETIPTNTPPEEEGSAEDMSEQSSGHVVVTNNDGPPFYARFGQGETFGDGDQVVIAFYRQPDCIPADFNLNQFFHFPGEDGPGAFACAPPTVSTVETWETAPGEDPAPLVAESAGLGAVPVWFLSAADMEEAMADGTATVSELAALPSRQVGTATTYTELLHPSQSNENPLVQFTAEGMLEDGSAFTVDVSKGADDVADHVTIVIGE